MILSFWSCLFDQVYLFPNLILLSQSCEKSHLLWLKQFYLFWPELSEHIFCFEAQVGNEESGQFENQLCLDASIAT